MNNNAFYHWPHCPPDDTIAVVKMHGRAEALRALRGCLYVVLLIRVASIEVESTNYTDMYVRV